MLYIRVNAFKYYVLPSIDYLAIFYVFQSHSTNEVIESIQRYFTRRLFNRIHQSQEVSDYSARLKIFGLDPLSVRYVRIYLITLFKLIHKQISVEEFHVNLSHRHLDKPLILDLFSFTRMCRMITDQLSLISRSVNQKALSERYLNKEDYETVDELLMCIIIS